MNILRESMTRILSRPFCVRVWRQEANLDIQTDNGDILREVSRLRRNEHISALQMAKELIKMDRVNAVEVLYTDYRGDPSNGEILYRCDEVTIGDKRLTII